MSVNDELDSVGEKREENKSDSEISEEEEIHYIPSDVGSSDKTIVEECKKRKPQYAGPEETPTELSSLVNDSFKKIGKRKPLHGKPDVSWEISSKTLSLFVTQYWMIITLLLFTACVCFFWGIYSHYFDDIDSTNNFHNVSYFRHETLHKIIKKYPSQPLNMIKKFFFAVDDVYQSSSLKDSSSVITILHCKDCKETADCLARDFATYASKVLNRTGKFENFDGSSGDGFYNLFIGCNDFKENLKKNGVLVVNNFHELSAEVAKLFHGLCDRYTPYIKSKVIYIIVIEISSDQEVISKLMEKVHLRINELWSVLGSHILDPLVTRLSENIIDVKQEKQLSGC